MNLWEKIATAWHPTGTANAKPTPAPSPVNWVAPDDLLAHSREIDLLGEVTTNEEPGEATGDTNQIEEREFAQEFKEEAKQTFESLGPEAIAFYAPIHFYGPRWGIYFNEQRFFGTCSLLSERLPSTPWDSIVMELMRSLEKHHLFHAACELFALVAEDFARLGFLNGERGSIENDYLLAQTESLCVYLGYWQNGYAKTFPGEDCIEESLATAAEFRSSVRAPGFPEALAVLLANAPASYGNWARYEFRDAFVTGTRELACQILSCAWRNAGQLKRMVQSVDLQEPTVWFPDVPTIELQGGPVPRHVYSPGSARPTRFSRLAVANVRLGAFLNAICRQYQARIVSDEKDKALMFHNGKKVPFPNTRSVPAYLVGDVARALGVAEREVLAACDTEK